MKQVSRLAHSLHSEDNHVFIHVDKKVPDDIIKNLFSYTRDLKNCYISTSRIDGKLDDRSLVDIVMVLISDAKAIEKIKSIHYSYYINMSGQDYPIKPVKYITNELEANYPALYMLYRDASSAKWVAHKFNRNKTLIRYRNWSIKHNNRIIRKILQAIGVILRQIIKLFGKTASQRISKNGWKYYQGSAWWVLPDYIINSIEKEYYSPSEFAKIMIDESTTPEETYFQSMVMHLFCFNAQEKHDQNLKINGLKTYVDFGDLSNKPVVCHPYVLTINDYDDLLKSDCWFARKFDETIDHKIIDKIDETILK